MIKYVTTNVKKLTPNQRRRLKKLTRGEDSHMKDILRWGSLANTYLYKEPGFKETYANIILSFDTDAKRIVGWASSEPSLENPNSKDVNVFVDPNRRGQGIGRELVTKLAKHDKVSTIDIHPHDKTSKAFYNKLGGTKVKANVADPLHTVPINLGHSSPILMKTLINPVTRNKIKVATALRYPKDHPARREADKLLHREK